MGGSLFSAFKMWAKVRQFPKPEKGGNGKSAALFNIDSQSKIKPAPLQWRIIIGWIEGITIWI
jgi:hypothetical protein